MKRLLALAAVAAVLLAPAFALADPLGAVTPGSAGTQSDLAGCYRPSSTPAPSAGQQMALSCDANGNLLIGTGSGATAQQVQGNVAGAVADVGNPVKVGCKYNASLPTYVDGQRTDCQVTSNGAFQVFVNGSSFLVGPSANGFGVSLVPDSSVGGGNVPTANVAVGSSLVVKASAGNLYGWRVVAGASAGFVLIFNATSAPGDGAVTPLDCIPVAANGTVGWSSDIPDRYSTGITIVFSTTGCFSKTASSTAYIRAAFQ